MARRVRGSDQGRRAPRPSGARLALGGGYRATCAHVMGYHNIGYHMGEYNKRRMRIVTRRLK